MENNDLKFYLEQGFDYINGCLKDGCKDDMKESLYKDYRKLEECLYGEARNKLAISYLVKFETRARATLKRLDKRFKAK